jgi:6-hydroxycyclohex-1-ene-1-carbonyl-CoA dehydrogenase
MPEATAYGLLTFGAHLAVVGFTMDTVELRLSNLMAFHAKAQGNWGCDVTLYPHALDLILDGRVKLAPFVEQHPLDSIQEIFTAAHAHQLSRRAILVPGA